MNTAKHAQFKIYFSSCLNVYNKRSCGWNNKGINIQFVNSIPLSNSEGIYIRRDDGELNSTVHLH